jgi:hypothetical protein
MLFFYPEYSRTFNKNNLVKNLGNAYTSANICGAAFFVTFDIDVSVTSSRLSSANVYGC